MTVRELRQKYLDFFISKGHTLFPSGSLVPYDVTGRLDESLLFNGAGMIQFKPYFRGIAQPESKRLTTCQKCVRTGDIEEVGDLSHLTFFEMLGNFSFGDYFAEEAIDFSWEFITSSHWLNLDPARCAFTIFEQDDVAYSRWASHLSQAKIDPATRVFRLTEETNFWPANSFTYGPPGPCGPNSEMFYWVDSSPIPTGTYTKDDFLMDESEGKWLEFWNDVFIQYEWQGEPRDPQRGPASGYTKTGMPNLPFRSIDTGMGLERSAVVLSGLTSVYDTDAFQPILQALSEKAKQNYGSTAKLDRAMRIISDHLRTACFCIADGILPGNSGRGYVLRRLIRRAVLQGERGLGLQESFLAPLSDDVIDTVGHHYPELVERADTIRELLAGEEELFRRTLRDGVTRLSLLMSQETSKTIQGDEAFKLYDTYGFPLESTLELASEEGFTVDVDGFEAAMKLAQERSRAGQERQTVYGGVEGGAMAEIAPTEFIGYENDTADGLRVLHSAPRGEDEWEIILNRTPFYATSGGQTYDTGRLVSEGVVADVWNGEVVRVEKSNGVFHHIVKALRPPVEVLRGEIDQIRRDDIRRNHTATHLLQAALREVLGTHVTQAGSFVGPDALRFDFTHGKGMTAAELEAVEDLVYEQVLKDEAVHTYVDIPIAEARARGAMALFGEKYGDKVRMVEIGEFSRELCGGTHVGSTGAIGLFKIVSESSAAGGVRRIEAVTGRGAYVWLRGQSAQMAAATHVLKAPADGLLAAIERQAELVKDLRKKLEAAKAQGAGAAEAVLVAVGSCELATQFADGVSLADAGPLADRLADVAVNRVVVVAARADGKGGFVVKAGKAAIQAGAHAGNLARELAKLTGGGGGGNPAFATAGAKDLAKMEAALSEASAVLAAQLGG